MKSYLKLSISTLFLVFLSSNSFIYAQSQLLEKVKNNPDEAIALCNRLKALNAKGISSGSKQVIQEISRERKLNATDAEILAIYVVGMYCPGVK